jgi:hypothetical protein
MRLGDWTLLALHALASSIQSPTDDRHLRTDPLYTEYRAPRPGSRLDRASRGVSCSPCMLKRAWSIDPVSGNSGR